MTRSENISEEFCDQLENITRCLGKDHYNLEQVFESAKLAYENKNDPNYNREEIGRLLEEIGDRLLYETRRQTPLSDEEMREFRVKRAWWFLGIYNEPEKMSFVIPAAIEGNADAQYKLGHDMVREFTEDALYWLKEAVDRGNLPAMCRLGCLLINGYEYGGIKENKGEASRLFIRAASQGAKSAQVKLIQIYLEGGEVDKALKWLQIAKKNKNEEDARIKEIFSRDLFCKSIDEIQSEVEEVNQW